LSDSVRYELAKIFTLRFRNEFGKNSGLVLEVGEIGISFGFAVNSFKLGAFGFGCTNFRSNERLVRAGGTRDRLGRGMLVQKVGKNGSELGGVIR